MEQHALIAEVNLKIRELSRSAYADSDYPVDFLCECGCLERVSVLASVYDAMEDPVVVDGHEAGRGDPAADAPAARERSRRTRQRPGLGGALPSEA